MDSLKTVIIAAVVALIIGGGIAWLDNDTTTILPVRNEGVGAISGPDIPYNYISVGGISAYYNKTTSLIQATTSVICSIQAPSATSTLVDGSINLTNSSTTGATTLAIYNSSKPYTAGEILATASVAEDTDYFLPAASSTYNAAAIRDRIFPGGSYFVVAQTGGGELTPQGTCQAVFLPAY